MDNQNNPAWPNTLNPNPSANGTTPPTLPPTDSNLPTTPVLPTAPLPSTPNTSTWPTSPSVFSPTPFTSSQPLTPNFNPTSDPTLNSKVPNGPSSWPNSPAAPDFSTPTPPVTTPDFSTPPSTFPTTDAQLSNQPAPAWNPNPVSNTPQPAPPPTFPQSTFPASPDSSNTLSTPNLNPSPLDNPWGQPTQASAVDGSASSSAPTWIPNQDKSPVGTENMQTMPDVATPPLSDATPQESVPTDLSHLISNNAQPENNQTILPSSSETLVAPSGSSTPEVPTLAAESGKGGLPKWLIGVGIGLLIIVAGASAYFILGIGQSGKNPTSIPAQIQKTTVKTPPPIATPIPQTALEPQATDSANFGQLQGGDEATQTATSAADLIKQRQKAK